MAPNEIILKIFGKFFDYLNKIICNSNCSEKHSGVAVNVGYIKCEAEKRNKKFYSVWKLLVHNYSL